MQITSSAPAAVGNATNPLAAAEGTDGGFAESHPAGALPAGDPLARFGALHGLHPGVQAFAYADKNGASGGKPGAGTGSGAAKTPPKPERCHALTPTPAKSHYTATSREVYDVAKTDPATIDKLKGSDDPATRRLGRTIENAKANYADLLPPASKENVPARIVVKLSDGNGGQPVMVLTGPGFDPTGRVTVHTHYHGDNATVADPLGSKAGSNARIRDVIAQHRQTVFVLPEADNTREGTDAPQADGACDYSRVGWRHVVSQDATTEDAVKSAGITGTVDERVVSLHSGGGKLVPRLMDVDKTGAGLRCDRLELLDSLYGNGKHDWKTGPDPYGWEQAVKAWAKTANGKQVKQVVYYHGTNDEPRALALKQAFAGRNVYVAHDMKEYGPSGPVNPVLRDAKGQTWQRTEHGTRNGRSVSWKVDVHKFEDNAHYRTTGQFLGADPPPLPAAPPPKPAAGNEPARVRSPKTP